MSILAFPLHGLLSRIYIEGTKAIISICALFKAPKMAFYIILHVIILHYMTWELLIYCCPTVECHFDVLACQCILTDWTIAALQTVAPNDFTSARCQCSYMDMDILASFFIQWEE